ncbi:oligosaccharide flippase family protein [Patescibacteria group bacterium]|nr:oligosaccharide flippase family protein [Patescibacteria group bacterium]MBU1730180.1 oligosaccharide flippase family protein [Patescibacteria group bacterium]
MFRKLLQLCQKEFSGLHEAAFLLGFFALLSQIMAVIRDRLFASMGAGVELDIYFASFRIPDILFVAIASFVALTVILPFFIEKLNTNKQQARDFINSIFTLFFLAIIIISIVVFFAVPYLVEIFFSGFEVGAQEEVVLLTRILLLSPILLGISNLFASITQTFRKFFVYALSPVLYNLGIILGLLFFYPSLGIIGLGFGVVLGAGLHMLIQVPVIIAHGFFPRFSLKMPASEIKKILILALPRTIGLSVQQIALFFLISIAASMAVGSIAVFQLSLNLQSVPLSIIGVSYSVAAFPTLARLYSKNKTKQFIDQVLTATRHIIFWSIPIAVLFVVLRAQIVRVILGSGKFDWDDTQLTAASFAIFSLSVVAQSLILLLVKGFYAAGKTLVPVVANVLCAGFIIIFAFFINNFLFTIPFFRDFIEILLRVENVPGSNILSLSIAYSAGVFINVFILWWLFKRAFSIGSCAQIQKTFRHSLYGSVIIGFVAYHLLDVFDDIFNLETFWGIFLQGLLAGLGGITIGTLLLIALKNDEIKEIVNAIHNKFWQTKTIVPDKDDLI